MGLISRVSSRTYRCSMPNPSKKTQKRKDDAESGYKNLVENNKEFIEARFSHLFDLEKIGVVEHSRSNSRASSVIFYPDKDVQNPTIGSSLVSTASTGFSD